ISPRSLRLLPKVPQACSASLVSCRSSPRAETLWVREGGGSRTLLPARHPGPPARSWRRHRQTSRSGARDADGATVSWLWTDSGMVGLPRTPRYYRFSPDLICEQLMRTGLAERSVAQCSTSVARASTEDGTAYPMA